MSEFVGHDGHEATAGAQRGKRGDARSRALGGRRTGVELQLQLQLQRQLLQLDDLE